MTKTITTTVLYEDRRYQLADVSVKDITVPEDRFRSVQTDDSLKALAVSLDTLGQTEEIGLREEGSKLVLIYGEARLTMLKELKQEFVRCKIWNVDPETALLIELMENVARGRHDPRRLLPYLVKVLASKKYKNSQLPGLFGVDKSEITKLKVISTMREDLQESFLANKVPVDTMYELRVLENDDAKLGALRLIVTSRYSKDASRHYIRHILACLCDKCRTTAKERDDYAPLALHGEKWLCRTCAPKEVPVPHKKGEKIEQLKQDHIGPSISTPQGDLTVTCPNCNNEYHHVLAMVQLCDQCRSRFKLLQARAVRDVGTEYWSLSESNLNKALEAVT